MITKNHMPPPAEAPPRPVCGLRADVVCPGLSQAQALENAKATKGPFIALPKLMDEGAGGA